MKAIPTIYNGRQYRSRLEARWAAMFDLLGWPFEYEPCDMDGWIPDFLLLGSEKVWVEIKPAVIGRDLAMFDTEKYYKALAAAGIKNDLLLLGITPVEDVSDACQHGIAFLGYLKEYGDFPDGETFVDGYAWLKYSREGNWDFAHDIMSFRGRMFEEKSWKCNHYQAPAWRELWNRAGNIVQWKGGLI